MPKFGLFVCEIIFRVNISKTSVHQAVNKNKVLEKFIDLKRNDSLRNWSDFSYLECIEVSLYFFRIIKKICGYISSSSTQTGVCAHYSESKTHLIARVC